MLLLLSGIVVALAALNLEHAVFEIMAGYRTEPTSNDVAFMIVSLSAIFAWIAFPIMLLVYMALILVRWTSRRRAGVG